MRMIIDNKSYDLIFGLVIFDVLMRLHPTFLPEVCSVYLFDVFISILILSSGYIKISRREAVVSVVFIVVLAIKIVLFRFDANSILTTLKFLYYILFYSYIIDQIKKPGRIEQLKKVFLVCFWGIVIIALIQFLEPPIISNIVYALFGEEKLRPLWSENPRVYSTFFNANWFAVFICGTSILFLSEYFRGKDTSKFFIRIMACIVMIIISGSRTGLLSLAVGVCVCLLANRKILPVVFSSLSIVMIIAVVFSVASKMAYFTDTLKRYTQLLTALSSTGHITDISSISERFLFWDISIHRIIESPLIGSEMGDLIPHNAFLTFVISFGMVGVVFVLPFLLMFLRRYISSRIDRVTRANNIALFCAYGIAMFTGDYLMSTQTMLSFLVILVLSNELYDYYSETNSANHFVNVIGDHAYGSYNCFLPSAVSSHSRK